MEPVRTLTESLVVALRSSGCGTASGGGHAVEASNLDVNQERRVPDHSWYSRESLLPMIPARAAEGQPNPGFLIRSPMILSCSGNIPCFLMNCCSQEVRAEQSPAAAMRCRVMAMPTVVACY